MPVRRGRGQVGLYLNWKVPRGMARLVFGRDRSRVFAVEPLLTAGPCSAEKACCNGVDLFLSRCFSGIQPGFPADTQTGRFTFGLLVIIMNENASPGTESESTVKHFLRPVVRFAFRRNAVFFSVWSRFLTVCGGDCKSGPVRPQRSLYTDETGLSRFRTWLCRPYRN